MAVQDVNNTLAVSQGVELTVNEKRKRLNMMLFLGQMLQNSKIYPHAAAMAISVILKKFFLNT